jgi:hypothetical protein
MWGLAWRTVDNDTLDRLFGELCSDVERCMYRSVDKPGEAEKSIHANNQVLMVQILPDASILANNFLQTIIRSIAHHDISSRYVNHRCSQE